MSFDTIAIQNPNAANETYGDDNLHLPPVADTYAARVSPRRRETIANRIASWFDAAPRGGARLIDIAAQLKIPLEVLHDERTRALLASRGIEEVRYPGLRYVFVYRALDGMPDGVALMDRWLRIANETGGDDIQGGNSDGAGAYKLHRNTQDVARKIHAFLAANAGEEFTYAPINAAVGLSSTTLKREPMERLLKDMGVRVRYYGKKGENGSRRYYSVRK